MKPSTNDQILALRGALQNLLEQACQMQGMFPDEDNSISLAIEDADIALEEPKIDPLDQYENALLQYLKKSSNNSSPSLVDLKTLWGWRCAIDPHYVSLTDLAEGLYVLCERLDILGPSLSIMPGGRDGFGVIADAAPNRTWTLSLKAGKIDSPLVDPDRIYWFRIIAVLCSRLRLSEVAKLPGYNRNAKLGPFGGGGSVVVD